MSAELSSFDDVIELAFKRNVPWHGMGQEVKEDMSLDEMIHAAHMEWAVERQRILQSLPNGRVLKPEMDILYRNDNFLPLSVVSPDYKIVQPAEIFNFYRSLIEDAGYSMDVIGALRQGKKIWALAKTATVEIQQNDKLDCYLLLATSYDGSIATTAKFTTVRVVCENTLNMSLRESSSVRVRHSTTFKPEVVMDKLIAQNEWIEQTKTLIDLRVSQQLAQDILIECINKKDPDKVRESKQFQKIMELFNGGGTMIQPNSGWGFLNAVTEYCDWYGRESKSNDTRLDAIWFKESLKEKAYNVLTGEV